MSDELITLDQARKVLGIGHSTIYRLIDNDPDFRTLKVGGRRMVRRKSLNEYIERLEKREMQARGVA